MKIIQVITLSEPIGGAQMVLFNNTKAMVKDGHEVHIFVGKEGALTSRLKELKVNVTLIPSLNRQINLIEDVRCFYHVRKLLKNHNPDIVLSHSSKAGILVRLACLKTGIRNIFTVHGWSFTPGVSGFKRYIYLVIEKLMGKFSDHLIAVSKYDYNLALEYNIVPEYKIRVVYNGSPDLKDKNCSKKGGVVSILMTARFSQQKDHLTLFKALQILKNEPIHVNLVGSGELYSKFVNLSKEMQLDDLITFHGGTDKMPYFLNKTDIFVLTSNFEGLPLSICEAMSVGIPILASDVGGVQEMVKNDYNGYLIPREDYKYLAEKLMDLVQDRSLLERLGDGSRKTYLEYFSIDQMWASTNKYISQILEEK